MKEPKFFKSPQAFHQWLEKHHGSVEALWVGFYKKNSGKQSITYPEALDEALCYGWIDGLRKSIDGDSYKIRFTPRKPSSIWSKINVGHVARLRQEGRMRPAGLKAFSALDPKRSGIYSFENQPVTLSAELRKRLQAHGSAWEFFEALPPYRKKTVVYWVMSAKKEETRLRRIDRLIESLAKGERLGVIVAKPTSTEV